MNDVRVAIKSIDIIMREEIPAEINENKEKKNIRQKKTLVSHFVKNIKIIFIHFIVRNFNFLVTQRVFTFCCCCILVSFSFICA